MFKKHYLRVVRIDQWVKALAGSWWLKLDPWDPHWEGGTNTHTLSSDLRMRIACVCSHTMHIK